MSDVIGIYRVRDRDVLDLLGTAAADIEKHTFDSGSRQGIAVCATITEDDYLQSLLWEDPAWGSSTFLEWGGTFIRVTYTRRQ